MPYPENQTTYLVLNTIEEISLLYKVKATFSAPRQPNIFSKLYMKEVKKVGKLFGKII